MMGAGAIRVAAILASICAGPQGAPHVAPRSQTPDPGPRTEASGDLTVAAIAFPRRDVSELRARARFEAEARPATWARFHVDAFTEGILAGRGDPAGRTSDGIVRVREAWFEASSRHLEVRAGFGRVAWGRLDEIQPSDVINSIDTARFFLDGRSEARLPVALVRARFIPSERWSVEGVVAPIFRRGRFDELDEATSPFNLINDAVLPANVFVTNPTIDRVTPPRTWSNISGGARLTVTAGRMDVSGSVYRGFEGFGAITFEPDVTTPPVPLIVGRLVERFPRFTMVAGDFESVTGDWAWRGEAAVFTEKKFAGVTRPGLVEGRALDAGAGFDRPAGGWQVFGSVVLHRQWSEEDAGVERTDVTLVGSVDRKFSRDRWRLRGFAAVNPASQSGFVRGVLVWQVRDALSLEGSAGSFVGTGDDTIARFSGRDFLFVRARQSW